MIHFKYKCEYYAVATENSYYVKKGTVKRISKKEALNIKKTGKHEFTFPFNMHWEKCLLKCDVMKKEITWSKFC